MSGRKRTISLDLNGNTYNLGTYSGGSPAGWTGGRNRSTSVMFFDSNGSYKGTGNYNYSYSK